MTQVICDICGKPILNGKIYPRGLVKQKDGGGKWHDIDVCRSCGDAMVRASSHSYTGTYNVKDLLKKENEELKRASREMTIDEIEKELGYKVKIINKEKNND